MSSSRIRDSSKGGDFLSREMMQHEQDRKFFRRTAMQTKAVNLGVVMMRGGIRF